MKRKDFDIAAGLIYRIDKLEKTIHTLQQMTNFTRFEIYAESEKVSTKIELNEVDVETEVFKQDILEYYINTLNLELNELRENFDNSFSDDSED